MSKKYKTIVFVLVALFIVCVIFVSMLGRQKNHINNQQADKYLKIDDSNAKKESPSELTYKKLTPEKEKLTSNIQTSAENENIVASYVQSFKESFYSNDMDELNKLVGVIFELGESAIPNLFEIISDEGNDLLLRKMVFELVRDIGLSPDHANFMLQIANNKDEDPIIRGEAVWALGLIESEVAIEPLIKYLADESEEDRIRKLSATSLGLLHATQAEQTLIETLNNQENNVKVRAAIVEALGALNSQPAFESIQNSLDDQSWEVQISSVKAIVNFNNNTSLPLLHKKLIDQIQKEKTDTNDAVVKSTIQSLTSIKSNKSVPILITILKGNDEYYSALAGKALGEIGDQRALTAIEEVLDTSNDPFQVKSLEEAVQKINVN